MTSIRWKRFVLSAVIVVAVGANLATGSIYHESYDNSTNDFTIATLERYQQFSAAFVQDGSAAVANGQLNILNGPTDSAQALRLVGVSGTNVSARVGASASFGSYNVGISVGPNNVVFHPEFLPIPGALRVEGPGGFGNSNLGFVPANVVPHDLSVSHTGGGNFNVNLTNGGNPAETFNAAFVNGGAVGGDIALRRAGQPVGRGIYDDLNIDGVVESFNSNTNVGRSGVFSFDLDDGRADVGGGQLELRSAGANTEQNTLRSGLKLPHTISAQIGADNSNGSYNVGLRVGPNRIVFHPGFGGGALRVEGPGGFGNTNVGFTPANGVAHQLDVTSDGSGNFIVTLTDGANPANTFSTSFSSPGAVGADFGPTRSGPTAGNAFVRSLALHPLAVNGSQQGASAILFDQSNDTQLTYGAGGRLNGGSAVVGSETLVLGTRPGNNDSQDFVFAGPTGSLDVSLDLGADNSNGSYNVGLQVGQNNIVFHPGLGGGALRVEGPGGFGNTNVGFTPANGLLHNLRVTGDGAGNFNLTLTDGANPGNVFNASFSNPGSVGGNVGPRRAGPSNGIGFYDNLIINGDTQTFATNTDATAHYPQLTPTLNGGGAYVDNGVLRVLPIANAPNNYVQNLLLDGRDGPFTLSAEIGADDSNGSYNVGLQIGPNNIVFHPGFGGGALRVEGPGGFGNTNVGFTPANDLLHLLLIQADGEGNFDVTLQDAGNPTNIFTTSFFSPGAVGQPMGLRRAGPTGGHALYDNLIILAPVPEPATVGLLVLSGAALLTRRRRTR